MMKSVIGLLICNLIAAGAAFAEPEVMPGVKPLDTVPVLKCPAVPEAYAKMITQLKSLKTNIKQEAACGPINMEVQNLETLLGTKRTEVEALIEKSKTEVLNEEDLKKIRTYVEDVTKKVLSTAQLVSGSNYCFLEDKKQFGFADLATITLDATALAKSVAGPWAVPITLGGQALAGIFQGLNMVMNNQRGYDFTKLDQRQAYVQSLCAYYNYRQDIENLLYPQKRITQLQDLQTRMRTHLTDLERNCPECSRFSQEVFGSDSSGPQAQLSTEARRIDSSYVRPLGTYTLRAISTLRWTNGQIEEVNSTLGDDTNIGRDFLAEIKADLDQFLIERQAPAFIKFQAKKGIDLYYAFQRYVSQEAYDLQMQAIPYAKTEYKQFYGMNELQIVQYIGSLAPSVRTAGQNTLAARIDDYVRQSMDLFERARIAQSVNQTYCLFFQKAGFYSSDIQGYCESGNQSKLDNYISKLVPANDQLNQAVGGSKYAVLDWVDSISSSVSKLSQDPNLYRRR